MTLLCRLRRIGETRKVGEMIVTLDEFYNVCCSCPLIGTVKKGNIKGLPDQQVLLREHFTDVCPTLLVSKDCEHPESALWAARLLKRHMYYHLHPELYDGGESSANLRSDNNDRHLENPGTSKVEK